MLMRTNYMKRNLLLAGAAVAMAVSANAGNWVDVTHKYVKEPAYLPGWQGVIGAVGEGVGEVWNGAFRLYQVVPDAPAGNYTLTCNALYRCGTNEYSFQNMKNNAELHTAYIFINDEKRPLRVLLMVLWFFREKAKPSMQLSTFPIVLEKPMHRSLPANS